MSRKIFLILGVTVFLVSGCSSLRNTFGLDHYQADEMRVDPNPPLTLPPNFKLRPPRPGAPNPNQRDHASEAASVLTGQSAGKSSKAAKSSNKTEDAVLSQAAAQS